MVQVRELTAKLGLTGSAADGLTKFGLAMGGVREGLALLKGAFSLAKAVLFDFTNDMAKAGDELAKTAKKIGISVTSLQELGFAAQLAGADFGKIQKAVQTMSKNLVDARQKGTGPFVDAMQVLNLTIEDFDGLGPEEVMDVFADGIAGLTDEMEQNAVAATVFGKGGKDLLPLFKEGSAGIEEFREEFRKLGGGFTEDGAAAAEEFIDAQLRLTTVIESVKIAIGTELFPVIQEIIDTVRVWAQENRALIKGKIVDFIRDMIKRVRELGPLLEDLVAFLKELGPVLLAVATAFVDFFRGMDGQDIKITLITAAFVALALAIGGLPGLFLAAAGALALFIGSSLSELSGLSAEIRTLNIELGRVKRKRQALEEGEGAFQVLAGGTAADLADLSEEDFEEAVEELIIAGVAAGPKALKTAESQIRLAEGRRDNELRLRNKESDVAFVERRTKKARGARRRKELEDRAKKKPKAKKKKEPKTTDEDLLRLIASVPGVDIEGAAERLLPGAPPVIAVQVTRNDFNIQAPVTLTITAAPGTSAEELREAFDDNFDENIRVVLEQAAAELQPATAR